MTRDEFIEYLSDKNNIKLTNEQKDIVFTINGPHTVISTAGSGKTTILCAKIANLILCNSVSTERILVVTFSRASAVDMDNRFKTQYGELVSDSVNFSTIHSFALSVVKNYFYKINKPFEIIEGGNASITKNKLLSILCKKHTGENVNEDKLKDVSGYISYIKNLMILYKDLDNYEDQYPLPKFKEIYKEYEDYKRDINQNGQRLMDYDDMLSMCYHVLKNNPSILKKYRNKYDYYLVDEAQDTSRVQHEILKLLAAPKFNICLVGDDSQSIYSWRGADVQEFIDFKTTYHRDGKILFMGQNFRSSKTIVDSSARFILENAKDRIEKKIYTNNETGQPIKFIGTDNEYEQNGYILNQLDRNNLKETAILYRNNISAIPIVDELIRNNISYYIKDDIPSFFNHFVTNDLLAIISFANDQCNVGKFENIYYKIKSYVSKQDILSLNYENRNKNVFDLLLEKSTSKAREKELKKFKIKFDLLSKMVPEKAFYYIENSLNYKEYIEDFSKILNYSIDSVENIISTLKIIAKGLNTIEEFIYKL
ncbi:MAG: ATP-dependent helicase, partial [Clostridiaceae bacterium]